MAQIICFANSYKRGGRCVAGIDQASQKWIRPIGEGTEGAIGIERLINGREPKLLDILEIPIGFNADDLDCQPENMILQKGPWRKTGEITANDALEYVENTDYLLHNHDKSIPVSEFSSNIRRADWKSLQLIKVTRAHFAKNQWDRLECNFKYSGHYYSLKALCPEAKKHLDSRIDCILTISLGGPFKRKDDDIVRCWKIVAGVIPL